MNDRPVSAPPQPTEDYVPSTGTGPSTEHPPAMADAERGELVGSIVGPYTLAHRLGHGGMGEVWLAEQSVPVHRQVALKVIRAGMDTASVMSRFEAERQTLALMDHPNIAKVLEAGATPAGRPYFAMELVPGVPITHFCDAHRLTIRERVALFIPICQAVQHAHQKGVIHRDLKPSNVLVAAYDGKLVPKVIDFGIAKATRPSLDNEVPQTETGALVGTPEFMAPEQADPGNADIDTRADVYALGVILYELLAGSLPFSRKQVAGGSLLALLRQVTTETPPTPSAKLSSSPALPEVAKNRGIAPVRLRRLVRGELDWIVMKCLEKDRSKRYPTANALAADLTRSLAGEAVSAGPPGAAYRARAFVRRHRGAVAAAGLLATSLVAGLLGTTWAMKVALAERDEKEKALQREADQRRAAEDNERTANSQRELARRQQRLAENTRDFLQFKLLGMADPRFQADTLRLAKRSTSDVKPNPTVRELLDRAAAELSPDRIDRQFPGEPMVQAQILRTVGNAYLGLREHEKAIENLNRAVELMTRAQGPDPVEVLDSSIDLGAAYAHAGRSEEAIAQFTRCLDAATRAFGSDHRSTLGARNNLAVTLNLSGRSAEAITQFEQLHDSMVRAFGPDHPNTLAMLNNLAEALKASGRLAEGIATTEKVYESASRILGPDHPNTLGTAGNLAASYGEVGRIAEAIALTERVRDLTAARLGADHPDTITAVNNLCVLYSKAGRIQEAITILEALRPVTERVNGPDHPLTLVVINSLGATYVELHRIADAIPFLERAREGRTRILGAKHPDTLTTLSALAGAYQAAGRPADVLSLRQRILEARTQAYGANHVQTHLARNALALALRELKRYAESIPLFEASRDGVASKLGVEHATTMAVAANLAGAYHLSGRLDDAIALMKTVHATRAKNMGPDHKVALNDLSYLGSLYLIAGRYVEAETAYRECLARRRRVEPEAWTIASLTSGIGETLTGQRRFDEAEPLLKEGYDELVRRQADLPAASRPRLLSAAAGRLASLYEAWDKPDEAAKWRDLANTHQAPAPP